MCGQPPRTQSPMGALYLERKQISRFARNDKRKKVFDKQIAGKGPSLRSTGPRASGASSAIEGILHGVIPTGAAFQARIDARVDALQA